MLPQELNCDHAVWKQKRRPLLLPDSNECKEKHMSLLILSLHWGWNRQRSFVFCTVVEGDQLEWKASLATHYVVRPLMFLLMLACWFLHVTLPIAPLILFYIWYTLQQTFLALFFSLFCVREMGSGVEIWLNVSGCLVCSPGCYNLSLRGKRQHQDLHGAQLCT